MGERLDSWKEIGAYLGRDVRTLQRWALTRGLPVRRLPGGGAKPRVFALPSELDAWLRAGVSRPALALELKLAPASTPRQLTEDVAAYELWLKGRGISQQYTPGSLAEARLCYEAAIARDPSFARPHFGLAELLFHAVQFGLTTSREDVRRAREAMGRALELDDHFGQAHALNGVFRGMLDYDWDGAEASFHRAFELSPGSANILLQHAWFHLVPRSRVAEALDEAEQAVALDPLSPLVRGRFGLVLIVARQYDRAVEECRAAVQVAPRLWWLHWFYATALLMQGKVAQGLKQAQRVCEQVHQPMTIGAMGLVYGLFPETRAKARHLLLELEQVASAAYVPPLAFAFACLGAGDDRVFEWLGKAIDARDPAVTQLPSMPFYDGIRNDPRFHGLLAKMNLA